MTLEGFAKWCDEEYARMAARRPGLFSRGDLVNEGRMAMLAEIGAALRTGRLPQHCPVSSDDLRRQAALVAAEERMCPNCVTPWKCNGPHITKNV